MGVQTLREHWDGEYAALRAQFNAGAISAETYEERLEQLQDAEADELEEAMNYGAEEDTYG